MNDIEGLVISALSVIAMVGVYFWAMERPDGEAEMILEDFARLDRERAVWREARNAATIPGALP